jgi:hypothetical protein
MVDNLVSATDTIRTTVSVLRRKVSGLKISVESFDSELAKLETKFDKLLTHTEVYKSKLQREMGREVRRLQAEMDSIRKEKEGLGSTPVIENSTENSIASTITIFECLLRHICQDSDDVKLMCYSILFPTIFERVVGAEDEAYFLHTLPQSSSTVIKRGREYVGFIRDLCETHVTDPEAWGVLIDPLSDWWKNDALPLVYGSRDEEWDSDLPLSLNEMLIWKNEPAERPIHFSRVFDGFEIHKKLKDKVYSDTGVRAFDLKMFTYSDPE